MKKFLTKLALFSIISVIAVSLSAPVTLANEKTDLEILSEAFDDIFSKGKDNRCYQEINADGSEGDDAGYIITIIEEPLSLEKEGEPGDDFQSRICYRNTLSFTEENGTEHTLAELANDTIKCKCVVKINTFSEDSIKHYNIKTSCEQVQVFLSKGGTALIYGYIGAIYKWAASIVGIIAVLVIIISGIQISAAGGDTQAIESAKARIIKSLAGIAVLFLSGLILYTINPTFFTK